MWLYKGFYNAVAILLSATTDAVFALQLIVSNTGSTGTIPSIDILSGLTPDSFTVIAFFAVPVPPLSNVNIASTIVD